MPLKVSTTFFLREEDGGVVGSAVGEQRKASTIRSKMDICELLNPVSEDEDVRFCSSQDAGDASSRSVSPVNPSLGSNVSVLSGSGHADANHQPPPLRRRETGSLGIHVIPDIVKGVQKPTQPSKSCHVCTRRGADLRKASCSNHRLGICRKVVCEICFYEWGWDLETALHDPDWVCSHCRGQCPPRSYCFNLPKYAEMRRIRRRRARERRYPTE